MLSVSKAFGFGEEGVSRATAFMDYRWYKRLWWRNSVAFRVATAASEGEDPRTFFLGGPSTLRGYDYLDLEGSRMGLVTVEYRYPLVDALIFGWPGRWGFQNVGGTAFMDMGAAWDKGDIRPFKKGRGLEFEDLNGDIGFGVHFYLGYFLLNFQLAWQTDLRTIGHSQFHFFLGPNF
jgi:outer membrane protein assembly factor BamA